jgi:hypothetical protein
MKEKITCCIVYVCAAVCSSWLLLCLMKRFRSPFRYTEFTLIACASAFLVASVIAFRWPRISHLLGLVSGLGALYWFYGIEFGYSFPALNTWVTFNLPDGTPDFSNDILFAKLKIIFAISALAATAISATRLLPSNWMIRHRPVRNRLWPALAVSALTTLMWYAVSVSPYRIPLIVDGVSAKLMLLHVQKNGSQFHETDIGVFNDGRVYFSHNDRRLLQYRFPVRTGSAVLTYHNTVRQAASELTEELANVDIAPAVRLHSKNAEGWYVRTQNGRVFAFTSENRTSPPSKLVTLFSAPQAAVPATKESADEKDICFGFCYDPLAGLGIRYMNERCTERNGTHCK